MSYLNKCNYCSKQWASSHPGKFCSSNCNNLFKASEKRKLINRERVCAECGNRFIAQRTSAKFCTPKCNNKYLYKQKDKSVYARVKREYNKNRLDIISKQRRERYKKDLNYKIACVLRARLNRAIKSNYKSGSAIADLGCSVEEFKIYLESLFEPGMTWGNWSRTGWHIDHIKPLSYFDLSDPEQLKEACRYTNLCPMWASDNISKGGTKYVRDA